MSTEKLKGKDESEGSAAVLPAPDNNIYNHESPSATEAIGLGEDPEPLLKRVKKFQEECDGKSEFSEIVEYLQNNFTHKELAFLFATEVAVEENPIERVLREMAEAINQR